MKRPRLLKNTKKLLAGGGERCTSQRKALSCRAPPGGGTSVIPGCAPCLRPTCHLLWQTLGPGMGGRTQSDTGASASACLSGLEQGLKAPHIKMDRKVCLGRKGDLLVLDEGAGMLKCHCQHSVPTPMSGRESRHCPAVPSLSGKVRLVLCACEAQHRTLHIGGAQSLSVGCPGCDRGTKAIWKGLAPATGAWSQGAQRGPVAEAQGIR